MNWLNRLDNFQRLFYGLWIVGLLSSFILPVPPLINMIYWLAFSGGFGLYIWLKKNRQQYKITLIILAINFVVILLSNGRYLLAALQ